MPVVVLFRRELPVERPQKLLRDSGNIALPIPERLEEAGIITARAGKVRLVKRDELPLDWNPATDKRLTVWEVTQHLIHRLDQGGESAAAALLPQLGGLAEVARDLAYRLYSTCERKKWAQEALAYNSLVVAWPELTKLARAVKTTDTGKRQQSLGLLESE